MTPGKQQLHHTQEPLLVLISVCSHGHWPLFEEETECSDEATHRFGCNVCFAHNESSSAARYIHSPSPEAPVRHEGLCSSAAAGSTASVPVVIDTSITAREAVRKTKSGPQRLIWREYSRVSSKRITINSCLIKGGKSTWSGNSSTNPPFTSSDASIPSATSRSGKKWSSGFESYVYHLASSSLARLLPMPWGRFSMM